MVFKRIDDQVSCMFCFQLMPEPKDYNLSYTCPHCGAFCAVEMPEDAYMVVGEASDHFGVDSTEIEVRSEPFDVLTDTEFGDPNQTGEVWNIYFARPSPGK